MTDIFFFSAGHFLRQVFSCKIFFSIEISLQDIFFLKSPIPPSKVKWSSKVSQLFLCPILDLFASKALLAFYKVEYCLSDSLISPVIQQWINSRIYGKQRNYKRV